MISPAVMGLLSEALENHRMGQFPKSKDLYRRVLALEPSQTEALCLVPIVSLEQSHDSATAKWGVRAVRASPLNTTARLNHSHHLRALDELDLALKHVEAAQVGDPTDPMPHYNAGVLNADLGRLEIAIRQYERSLVINPDGLLAQSNLGLALLAVGEMTRGWQLYETRFKYQDFSAWSTFNFGYPQWDGSSALNGKKILLWSEQGLGDTLQFCRFASILGRSGALVTILTHTPLQRILRTLPNICEVVGEAPQDQDCHFPLMSLPLALNVTVDSIPFSADRYLAAATPEVDRWTRLLAHLNHPKVGIVWRAGSVSNIAGRSVPLSAFRALCGIGVNFLPLQKELEIHERQLIDVLDGFQPLLQPQIDFADTAAIIEILDLVLTVDTSVAHLSASMGKETWLLLPKIADWRWMTGRDDSPWYSSIRIFRQKDRGDWGDVLVAVRSALTERFGLDNNAPPSNGV
jgi:hypothetical protein